MFAGLESSEPWQPKRADPSSLGMITQLIESFAELGRSTFCPADRILLAAPPLSISQASLVAGAESGVFRVAWGARELRV
jgi:hypothetical protein